MIPVFFINTGIRLMENLWAPWRMEYIAGHDKKVDGCVFCEAIKNPDDHANHIVFRGKYSFVILNKFPYNNGHIMIIPNQHTNDWLKLPDNVQAECYKMINLSISAIRKVFSPDALNLGMNLGKAAGAGIDEHVHFHILPRWEGDTNFMPVIAGTKVISESLDSAYTKLKQAFSEIEL